MYVGSLAVVVQESNYYGHANQIEDTITRGADAIRNNIDDDEKEYKEWKKYSERKNKGGIDSALKSFGYRQGLKTKDDNKTIGYHLVKGTYKTLRPITHLADNISKGYDYLGDKFKSTKIGKKINDTIDDYYHDDSGKHAAVHALGKGLSSYALGRIGADANGVGNNKYYKAADAGIGAVGAINSYQLAKQKAKRTPEQLKKIRWYRDQTEKIKRKERDDRMNNFWKDMKA